MTSRKSLSETHKSTSNMEAYRSLSLTDKLKAHYNHRKKEPLSPHFCNKISPPWYLSTILGAWLIAQTIAFPSLYENSSSLLLFQRFISTFIFVEIMVNWLCIRYVTSAYLPGVHDRKPAHEPSSVDVTRDDDDDNDVHSINGQPVEPKDDIEIKRYPDTEPKYEKFTVYIATELPNPETGIPKRTAYPYWSWKPCLLCNRSRPPRCHHCPVCRTCVLKRDHHCYFTGSCIGVSNQRHFVVFNFWASVGTIYAMAHAIPFVYYDIMPTTSLVDLFLPLTVARFFFGYLPLRSFCVISLVWSVSLFTVYSTTFFYEQLELVKYSRTSFECDSNITIYDTRSLDERLRSVFGKKWLLNFLVPMHRHYLPEEDPINWPTIEK